MALCTAAEVRMLLPNLTGTGEDSNLSALITRCGVAFARWCGYPGNVPSMEAASYVSYVDGSGSRDLVLPVWPVNSITSIYDDNTLDFTSSTYLVSSSDYMLLEEKYVRLKSTAIHGRWQSGSKNIKVSYNAGYSSIPDDLKQLCMHQVKSIWQSRHSQGIANETKADVSTSWRDEDFIPVKVKEALAPFRLPGCFI